MNLAVPPVVEKSVTPEGKVITEAPPVEGAYKSSVPDVVPRNRKLPERKECKPVHVGEIAGSIACAASLLKHVVATPLTTVIPIKEEGLAKVHPPPPPLPDVLI
jgi:hypothetical protein